MPVTVVLGMQWGDEGKGKVVDLLSGKSDLVVRSQGGSNAGHTIKIGDKEFKFHLIPSGILYDHTICILGGNVALDPEILFGELDLLEKLGIKFSGRFFISLNAPVVFAYHKIQDTLEELKKGKGAVGSTKMGIGPLYSDKALRIGLRVCDLIDKDILKGKLKTAIDLKNELFVKLYGQKPLSFDEVYEKYAAFGQRLKLFSCQTEVKIGEALREGKKILLEGAQGALLDTTFGTYPYVTSSSTLASGIASGAPIAMNKIGKVLGVVKAYMTRVGAGPMPTELSSDDRKLFPSNETLREVGTTTGRARRIGWFDAVMLRYCALINGTTALAVTKLDILSGFKKVKFCTSYELDGKKLSYPPASSEELSRVIPIYEELPGWSEDIGRMKNFDDLPKNARSYLDRIKEEAQLPLAMVSVGPERESSIWVGDGRN